MGPVDTSGAASSGAAPTHRALVPFAPARPEDAAHSRPMPAHPRAEAAFLTHLIATAQGAPQTRERRRADPNWAITTYAAMMRIPAPTGWRINEYRL
jgi:hypothetical protein